MAEAQSKVHVHVDVNTNRVHARVVVGRIDDVGHFDVNIQSVDCGFSPLLFFSSYPDFKAQS